MLSRILTVLIAIVVTFSTAKLQAQQIPPGIDSVMKKFDAIGLAVAVVKDGRIIYNNSFGWKNREQQIPLQNTDIFRIASISKSFSATAIMQLVESGKLSLDDDFSKLIGFQVRNPKFPETVITLRMVLSHTSSLNDSQGYFSLDVIDPAKNPGSAKCYNNYEPGKGYQYCNLNYNMAGTVIEKISGERFDQYVKKHILDPLNLYGGYCVDSLDKSRFVTLYEYDGATKLFKPAPAAYNQRSEVIRNYVMGSSTPIFSPTGGMKISAADLAQYMIMHMNAGKSGKVRIISKKSARTMQTPLSDGEGGYGLALWRARDLVAGKELTGHTGSAYGLYSSMFFHPKEKFGFVTITNGCNPAYKDDLPQFTRELISVLYKDFILRK
ncbi:serine hydrolase [Pedobacter sp. SYP-B3415]|uniref:serine hydrolase domain-containing protein n=1 Tax=Pedobacter sp. SYP-B3415 TaxID=2496641 RepID=UPI00101CC075|nr:serine hydrolase domain-containing protein [Pedobacter sp. SYP-B3415]